MEIASFIYQLLFDNEIVIIPGFGAFVSNYKPARMDDNKETIFPPSKEISFDRKLINNDGLLVRFVATTEGISRVKALEIIVEFRENIQYRLEKGETIEFDRLGTLKLDEKNNTVFVSSSVENFLLDSYGLGEISLKKEPKIQEQEEVSVAEKLKTKSKGWLLFLLIPFAAMAVFVYLNFFSPKKHNNILPETYILTPDTTVVDEQKANTDSVQSELAKDTITSSTGGDKKPEVNNLPGGKYYLIGGSFMEKENADKYFNKVTRLGFLPVDLGKQGDFFVVAVGMFDSLGKAETARSEFLEKEPNSGVYIIKVGGD